MSSAINLHFANADDLASYYFLARERVGAIHALPIPVVAAERCRRDGSLPTWVLNESGRWRKRCSGCDLPWGNVAVATKSYRGGGKADAYTSAHRVEDALAAQLAPVELLRGVFEPRPRNSTEEHWRFALAAWEIYLHPQVASVAEVAAIGARLSGDERSELWRPVAAGAAITFAREIVEERASRPGRWLLASTQKERSA